MSQSGALTGTAPLLRRLSSPRSSCSTSVLMHHDAPGILELELELYRCLQLPLRMRPILIMSEHELTCLEFTAEGQEYGLKVKK